MKINESVYFKCVQIECKGKQSSKTKKDREHANPKSLWLASTKLKFNQVSVVFLAWGKQGEICAFSHLHML